MEADAIRDLFRAFGAVSVRRMFGGAGIYADGVMFALVADDVIYLKAGPDNAAEFDREKLPAFTYETKGGKRAVMSYRRMPDRLYDDPEELATWAKGAVLAARLSAKSRGAGGKSAVRVARRPETRRAKR